MNSGDAPALTLHRYRQWALLADHTAQPTSGQSGCITLVAWGVQTASKRGAESQVAHKWARWLHNPCRLGVPTASEQGAESEVARNWTRWLHNPAAWGSKPLRSGGEHQKWPTSGQSGYITPAAWGVPMASERGERIRSGPQVGKVAKCPLPPGGSPPLQSGGQKQKWPTSGQGGYITPAAWRVPTASERGAGSEVARNWTRWLHNPATWGPHRFRAGGRIRSGPQVG